MNIRCENCGHTALDTDSTCWHCGKPLPGREDAGRNKVKVRDSWGQSAGPTSLIVYGGLTLFVILGAILLMASLGKQPQLQVRFGTRTQDGWSFINSANHQFTVSLPDEWSWLDGTDMETAIELAQLVEDQPVLRLASYPLGAEVQDLTVLFAASSTFVGDEGAPLLIIAGSPLLNHLSYQEALEFLANSDYDVEQVVLVDDYDKTHLSIVVDPPIQDDISGDGTDIIIRCRQQFVLGREESLLVSLCAQPTQARANAPTFDEIMASFQHLDI